MNDINPTQAMLNGMMAAFSGKRHEDETHLTLGGFIDALRDIPDQTKLIEYDNGLPLGEWGSYRGYYEDLQNEPGDTARTVADVLISAQECMGECFEGYKGGDFYMSRRTLLWLGYYGTTGNSRQITGVEDRGGKVVVTTRIESDA